MATAKISPELLSSYKTQSGQTLGALSDERPILLVFLRHFGCTFCREAVAEISKIRNDIEARGTQLAFVHLASDDDKARKFFAPYSFQDLPRFADPEGRLFQSFGLVRGNWRAFLNYDSILRTLMAWLDGHWLGMPVGDVQRMPGTFLIQDGEIRKAFRNKLVSDRPDYLELATPSGFLKPGLTPAKSF
jgi:peroxiredoxin